MLVLLITFAVLGVGFGQSSDTDCPTLKEVRSSQEALASQLRDVLAKYNQQQSSESLTSLMQLLLHGQTAHGRNYSKHTHCWRGYYF